MPNQRAKNKLFFGGFIDRRFKAQIKRAAADAGMKDNVFGFAMSMSLPRTQRLRLGLAGVPRRASRRS